MFFRLVCLQIIDESVLCVHGGLSPDLKTLDQIRTIERNQEIPHKGAFCDILFLNHCYFTVCCTLFTLSGNDSIECIVYLTIYIKLICT
jgi:hypothetical protein